MADELVPMAKDGEVLDVHSTCVKAHKDAGWRELPAKPAEEPTKKGGKAAPKE